MKKSIAHTDQAAEFLGRWLSVDRPWQLDRFLAQVVKEDKRLGRRDRQALSEGVFAAVRYASLSRAVLNLAARGELHADFTDLQALKTLPIDRALSITMARYVREDWPLRGLEKYSLGDKLGRAFTEIEAHAGEHFPYWLAWHGIDPAWEPVLRARANASDWTEDELREFVALQVTRPPMWLRLNRPDQRDAVLAELETGYDVDLDGDALAVIGPRGIYDLECYKNGDIEIQDRASQEVGRVLAPKPGETVWDACAGGGGKTLQLAAMMKGRGAVHASDIRGNMLEEVARRAKRADLHNVRTFVWDGEAAPEFSREVEKRKGYDAVLVDAPCSASGTWRRNPDARYRYASVGDLPALQQKLLTAASAAVRPGGRLVYSTCSFRVEENEDVVAAFLAGNSQFTLDSQALHGCPQIDADAMFVARLLRAAQ